MNFFVDMGARVAENKCFITSTSQHVRDILRKHKWDDEGTTIPVVNHFRDLGTHVCMDATNTAKTLRKKMEKATNMTNRLRWVPVPRGIKEKVIRTNILPMALYASEAASISVSEMQK